MSTPTLYWAADGDGQRLTDSTGKALLVSKVRPCRCEFNRRWECQDRAGRTLWFFESSLRPANPQPSTQPK